jgi:hypothetical protein
LREGEPAERCGDECRAFDHAQIRERCHRRPKLTAR